MNILITCHLPPGFNHQNVFQLNTNVYKKNKTRKVRNLKNTVDTYFYLDTSFEVPENTKNFFSNWEDVPDNSLDIIWGHNCLFWMKTMALFGMISWNMVNES